MQLTCAKPDILAVLSMLQQSQLRNLVDKNVAITDMVNVRLGPVGANIALGMDADGRLTINIARIVPFDLFGLGRVKVEKMLLQKIPFSRKVDGHIVVDIPFVHIQSIQISSGVLIISAAAA